MTATKFVCGEPVSPTHKLSRMQSPDQSIIRNYIPSDTFPAENNRYVLYINHCCPYCHRAVIALKLRGLENSIQLVEVDSKDETHGWCFSGNDPVTRKRLVRELYLMTDPSYAGRTILPLLWDKVHGVVVSNDSADIVRILITSFDHLVPPERREFTAFLFPDDLQKDINRFYTDTCLELQQLIFKVGMANSQVMYNENNPKIFECLDRIEQRLSQPKTGPYLFGHHITAADIHLFATIIRFDVAYHTIYKCNNKTIRHNYRQIHRWLKRLYWSEGPETAGGVFKTTTDFDEIKRGLATYAQGNWLIPNGPDPDMMPPSP